MRKIMLTAVATVGIIGATAGPALANGTDVSPLLTRTSTQHVVTGYHPDVVNGGTPYCGPGQRWSAGHCVSTAPKKPAQRSDTAGAYGVAGIGLIALLFLI